MQRPDTSKSSPVAPLDADLAPLQGELQSLVMAALWRLDGGTVEQVRSALPVERRGAYTTVQTVLNRLVDRGLVTREKAGRGHVFTPRFPESEYLSRTITHALSGASGAARQAALASILGRLDDEQRSEVQRLARAVRRRRAQDG